MPSSSTSTTSILNTDTRVRGCGVYHNISLALLIVILPFFTTIGSSMMWLLQDKIPVIVQSTQPKRWTKQQLQQSITNCHVICDTVLREHPSYRISPTITTFTLLISNLHGNANEPYGRVPLSDDDDTRMADQAHQDRVDDTVGEQVAASSDNDDDDDDDDSRKRKIHNNECGGDESPTDQNDNDQGDEEDNDNRFFGEPVEVTGSDNPNDFLILVLDDDTDIIEDDMVEVGVVDETEEEDMVGLWEE